MFVLVVLLLHGHVWGSIRVHTLTSSSLLLQQCPACHVRLTWIVFVIGGRWPYSWCLVGCCRQGLFKIDVNMCILGKISWYHHKTKMQGFSNKQSLLAWQWVNYFNGKKNNFRSKVNANRHKESLHKLKEYVTNLRGNPLEVIQRLTEENIKGQLSTSNLDTLQTRK